MRPSAHLARRIAAIIGLIGAMLMTGGADWTVSDSRVTERATAATDEARGKAAGRDETSGRDPDSGPEEASGREEGSGDGRKEDSGRDEASGRDGALEAVGDRLDDLGDQTTDVVDDTVDHTTDTVDDTVDHTTDTVDDVVDETTDAVDGVTDDRLNETTDTVDDTVDHTTDTVDDVVGRTTGVVDGVVDGTTDTLDRVTTGLRGNEQDAGGSPPVEAQPPPADGDAGPVEGEPASPVDPALPTAVAPPGEPPEGASIAEEDAEADDGADGSAPSDRDEAGSLFDGSGGISERAPFPLALMLILAGFLGVQAWVDRRDPKLAAAPLETEPDLVFERP